jgi:hypothetical protein
MSAADRSRSRSPTGRISRGFLARVLTPRFNYGAYLSTWLRHLLSRPVILESHVYFELLKMHDYLPGKLWLRLEVPYVVHSRGSVYALDFTLWHGDVLDTSLLISLSRGSANGGRALTLNWPRAPRGRGKVVVSRIVGMSLFFDTDRFGRRGIQRYDAGIHVHHIDDVHENCLLRNLQVCMGSEHVSHHNRRR